MIAVSDQPHFGSYFGPLGWVCIDAQAQDVREAHVVSLRPMTWMCRQFPGRNCNSLNAARRSLGV